VCRGIVVGVYGGKGEAIKEHTWVKSPYLRQYVGTQLNMRGSTWGGQAYTITKVELEEGVKASKSVDCSKAALD